MVPDTTLATVIHATWFRGMRDAGFSLRVSVLASTNIHRLKPAPLHSAYKDISVGRKAKARMAPRKQNSDISISLARNQPPQFASLPSKSPPNAAPPYRLVTNIPEPRLERLRRKAFTWHPARLTYKIALPVTP